MRVDLLVNRMGVTGSDVKRMIHWLTLFVVLVSPNLLAQDPQPTEADTVDQQLRLLQESESALLRRKAIWNLGGQPGREIKEAILQALNDPEATVRSAAIYQLMDEGWPIPPAALRQAARDGNSDVRTAAIWATMTLYPAQHLDTVSAALDDSDPKVRTAAVWAAAEFSRAFDPELFAKIVRLFDRCVGKECSAIIRALLKHRDQLPDSVRSRLMSKRSAVREIAAQTIGESAARGEIQTVQALAADSIPWVRAAAADTFGVLAHKYNDKNIEAMLLRLLGDESSDVRHAAADALERLGFVAPANILDFIEEKTDDTPWIARRDQTNIEPILMGLWSTLQDAERRRLADLLMTWNYEPAVEAGLALVGSHNLLDRMTGWQGLMGFRDSAYLGRAMLATLTSPFTWLYLLVVAAVITWAVLARNGIREFFSNAD